MKLKLLAPKIKNKGVSVRKKGVKQGKFVYVLLAIGVLMCAGAIALYMFQGMIPRPSFDSSGLIIPSSSRHEDINFQEALHQGGIDFDSVTFATESPTLVVKLPTGTYVYLNSTEDPTPALKILKNLLQRISIEDKNKTIKYVDLRFEKPIVKF